MKYSTEPKFRKYVKGYGFFSFPRKFGDKYGKKIIDTATKTIINAAKTASKRVVQKTAEAAGDLIGNKITDQITSIGKTKEKEYTNKPEETYILPEKRQQIIDDPKLFWMIIIIMKLNIFYCHCHSHSHWDIIIILIIIIILLHRNGISKNYKFAWYNFWQ